MNDADMENMQSSLEVIADKLDKILGVLQSIKAAGESPTIKLAGGLLNLDLGRLIARMNEQGVPPGKKTLDEMVREDVFDAERTGPLSSAYCTCPAGFVGNDVTGNCLYCGKPPMLGQKP